MGKYYAFAFAVPLYFWFGYAFERVLSLDKNRRKLGFALLLGTFAAVALIQGIRTHGDRFDRETGTANYTYSVSDGRIIIHPNSVKYDPDNGEKTNPLSPEIARRLEEEEKKRKSEEAERERRSFGGLAEMKGLYR